MTHRTYLLPLVLALLLLLSLTACGDSSSDDPQSGYETVMDMEFLDGMWSIDGTSRLYFDSEEGFYAYRTGWGLGGRGEFELSEASGRPMIFFRTHHVGTVTDSKSRSQHCKNCGQYRHQNRTNTGLSG